MTMSSDVNKSESHKRRAMYRNVHHIILLLIHFVLIVVVHY